MAITRCPYCHAIVDESSKYCPNCGTQLLFTEDDEIEEEIPGEKIVDLEIDEKDYSTGEPEEVTGEVSGQAAGEEAAEKPAEESQEESTRTSFPELEAEAEEREAAGSLRTGSGQGCAGEKDEQPVVEGGEPSGEEKAGSGTEAGYFVEPEEKKQAEGTVSLAEGTFETRELDKIGRTVDLGRQGLEEILNGLEDEQKAGAGESGAPESPGAETTGSAGSSDTAGVRPEGDTTEKTGESGSLPPWADRMINPPEEPETRKKDLGELFAGEKSSDSTMGLPEQDVTPVLPYYEEEEQEEEELEEEKEKQAEEEGERVISEEPEEEPDEELEEVELGAEETKEVEEEEEEVREEAEPFFYPRPDIPPAAETPADVRETARPAAGPFAGAGPTTARARIKAFSLSVFFKSLVFDLLFIGVFWLLALWLAARSMAATLFDLLAVTPRPVLILYVLLAGVYFFLFKFFLGETLGDRLFKERDG